MLHLSTLQDAQQSAEASSLDLRLAREAITEALF
jgi:hypothetical protein